MDVVELDGKSLLRVYVPESSQVHRCNGRIYDRNEDGDLDITDHTSLVAHLYQRKQATFSENKVYPWIQVDDLRPELIEKCRRYVRINRDNHPWADMDELDRCIFQGDRPCRRTVFWYAQDDDVRKKVRRSVPSS